MGNFYEDVISRDARVEKGDRVSDLGLLEPVTRQRVEAIIDDARGEGLALMVFETYRSKARQQELFQQGATRLQQVGVHHYGLACDIVKSVGGEPSWKGSFDVLGRLAQKHGLIWGGDWGDPAAHHDFVDAVHVQRCTVAKQKELFARTWYPDAGYDPYR
jgi:hypothetical protein